MELFLLCIKLFFVRIMDVSLGTVRAVMTVKEKNGIATLIGFVEVTIWFLAVKDALNSDSNSLWIVFSYAGGFAAGTYIGGIIAQKFIHGKLGIQIIVKKNAYPLIEELRKHHYAISVLNAKGSSGDDKLFLFLEIDSHYLEELKKLVHRYDEKAFLVVSETKYVQNGYFRNLAK